MSKSEKSLKFLIENLFFKLVRYQTSVIYVDGKEITSKCYINILGSIVL